MIDDKEFEYKYYANDIKLKEFVSLMEKMGFKKRLDASSWDTYYVKPDEKTEFQRFRHSSQPEITKKRKVKSTNNWTRIELDLPLDKERVTEEIVAAYVGLDGYEKNFSIYKSCFIFWQDKVNYVYYIVYDENMKELSRFIEVEVNKNKIPGLLTEEDQKTGGFSGVEEVLNQAASELKKLGLTPQNRLKKSLFELYVKS